MLLGYLLPDFFYFFIGIIVKHPTEVIFISQFLCIINKEYGNDNDGTCFSL
jgi:hypothetical protein